MCVYNYVHIISFTYYKKCVEGIYTKLEEYLKYVEALYMLYRGQLISKF